MYTNDGVASRGRAAIIQRLQSIAELRANFGSGLHQVDSMESQHIKVSWIELLLMMPVGQCHEMDLKYQPIAGAALTLPQQ